MRIWNIFKSLLLVFPYGRQQIEICEGAAQADLPLIPSPGPPLRPLQLPLLPRAQKIVQTPHQNHNPTPRVQENLQPRQDLPRQQDRPRHTPRKVSHVQLHLHPQREELQRGQTRSQIGQDSRAVPVDRGRQLRRRFSQSNTDHGHSQDSLEAVCRQSEDFAHWDGVLKNHPVIYRKKQD